MCTVRWKPVAALAGLSLLWRKLEPGASGPFGHLVAAMAALAVTSPISAQQALPSACDRADPATCLYSSELAYDVGEIDGVSLTDTARDNYDLPLVIRYPVGAPGPRPVVIWHHGGNPSARGATRSEEWSRNLAAAGYVVVHPSRTLIADPTPFEAECRDNGFKVPDECAYCELRNLASSGAISRTNLTRTLRGKSGSARRELIRIGQDVATQLGIKDVAIVRIGDQIWGVPTSAAQRGADWHVGHFGEAFTDLVNRVDGSMSVTKFRNWHWNLGFLEAAGPNMAKGAATTAIEGAH